MILFNNEALSVKYWQIESFAKSIADIHLWNNENNALLLIKSSEYLQNLNNLANLRNYLNELYSGISFIEESINKK